MTTIGFFVPGEPKGNARHRTPRSGHTYTPQSTTAARAEIAAAYLDAVGAIFPHEGPVELDIVACFGIRSSWPKWKRALAMSEDVPCCTKPDADNIAKLVADSLNCIAYRDDSQIHSLTVSKMYSQSPGLHVWLSLQEPTRQHAGESAR